MSKSTISTFELFQMFPDAEAAQLERRLQPQVWTREGHAPQGAQVPRGGCLIMDALAPTTWGQMDKDARHDAVRRLAHDEHLSASGIAAAIPGATRNAVIGVIHRSKGAIRLARMPDRQALPGAVKPLRGARRKGSPDRTIRPFKVPPQTTHELFHAPAWQPLPDTTPVPLMDRDTDGCRWPVTVEGQTLFCNCHVPKRDDELVYCDAHMQLYRGAPND